MSKYSKNWRSMEDEDKGDPCCDSKWFMEEEIQLLCSVHRPLHFNTAIVQCA